MPFQAYRKTLFTTYAVWGVSFQHIWDLKCRFLRFLRSSSFFQ